MISVGEVRSVPMFCGLGSFYTNVCMPSSFTPEHVSVGTQHPPLTVVFSSLLCMVKMRVYARYGLQRTR